MKRGVNAWCYPEHFSISEILENSARIGYEGVELNLDEAKIDPFKVSDKELAEIKSRAEQFDIALPSLSTGLHWKHNLASSNEEIRKKGVEVLKRGCRIAAELGAKVFLLVPGVATPEVQYQTMWDLSKAGILEAADVASEVGVTIAVENVWNRFLYSPLEFRRFLKEIGHPRVKAYFDIGNCLHLGHPQQWIEILGSDIACVHLKDFSLDRLEFRPILQGDVPWVEVMKSLRSVGYDYYLNVEVPPYPGSDLKSVKDSKASLDELLSMR